MHHLHTYIHTYIHTYMHACIHILYFNTIRFKPFLLNATLQHHVKRFEIFDPRFVAKLLDSFSVDDFVDGGATTQESMELYQKTQSRMTEGGFKLR